MTSDQFVLEAASKPVLPSLRELAHALVQTVDAIEARGFKAEQDPAVLILGAFIAFHTHADVNTVGGYQRLLSLCESRLIAASGFASSDEVDLQ